MRIVSIFCEIDNFFLAFGKYQAQRQLTENQNQPLLFSIYSYRFSARR